MSRPKATGDKDLKKAKAKIADLTEQLSQASMGILNMRMMYEAAVQEKAALQGNIDNLQNLLTGMLHQERKQTITLKEKTFPRIGDYAGIDTQAINGELVIKLVPFTEEEE